jgi:two-component system chemotaxis response regulator CheB
MEMKTESAPIGKQVSILIVSSSLDLKVALGKIILQTKMLGICGEAANCREAQNLLETAHPDVILVDQDVVQLDDLALLQEDMQDKQVPIIFLANGPEKSLTASFEALRNGAVDFICKDTLFERYNDVSYRKVIREAVVNGAKLSVSPPVSAAELVIESETGAEEQDTIVFCEDCGARNTFAAKETREALLCSECGDQLFSHEIRRHTRTHYVTVIGAGAGSYANLLRILPMAPSAISGAIIVVIYDDTERIDLFTDFLDSVSGVNVTRIRNSTGIEGGNCYVAAASEFFCMQPYSTGNTMARGKVVPGHGPVDLMLESVSTVFKKKSACLIVSGAERDGRHGVDSLKEHGGISAVLFPGDCLHRQMGEAVLRACRVDKIVDTNNAARFIYDLHDSARDSTAAS